MTLLGSAAAAMAGRQETSDWAQVASLAVCPRKAASVNGLSERCQNSRLLFDVLLKQLHDPLLLCFRFTRTGAAAPTILNREQHWRRAVLVLASGVGATLQESFNGCGTARAYSAV